jgi:methionine sulfoxide reductase heme-binding subunit
MQRNKITNLNLTVHIAAVIPFIVLAWDYLNNNLTINPVQAAEQRTGKIALVLLILSLSCTPVNTIFGFRPVLRLRRPLGVYAFAYAALHFFIFSVIDYGLDSSLLYGAIFEKPYTIVGLCALLILLALAATSWKWWMKKLGMAWKHLHQLVYAAGLLVILHYTWSIKGDLFRLQGQILQPFLFGLLLIFLLIMRLTPVRKWIVSKRMSLHDNKASMWFRTGVDHLRGL